ncbi:ThiJ/PfpI [Pseudomonas fluorescens Q2-87]|uniref:ThiJ/PfpI n=1 Tax=Pseudomonas fluorescens (strain Q2-87) TaxID=1038922 RepID=J2MTS3_PSEFQ|nr:ThiJ/PfpI [Pseudomonas fluorescens Q2-87]
MVVAIGGMVWEHAEAPDICDFLQARRSSGATVACAVFEGAGLSSEIIAQFRSMLAAEHE